MLLKEQDRVTIPNFVPRGTKNPLFYVIDKDWSEKERGFGPFLTMEEATRVAVEYNGERTRNSHKNEFPARVVRLDPLKGRQKAVKVLNAPPRHQPVGAYEESGGW